MSDPFDIMAWRAELAVIGFEGCFSHIKAAAKFLEMGEYEMAVKAVERAMPFWAGSLDEMRTIRSTVTTKKATGDAAAEYRAERDSKRKTTVPVRRVAAE